MVGIPLQSAGLVSFLRWFPSWSYRSILVLTCLGIPIIAFGFLTSITCLLDSDNEIRRWLSSILLCDLVQYLRWLALLASFIFPIVSAVQVLILYMGWSAIGINLRVASLFAFYRRAVSPEAIVIFQFLFPFLFMVLPALHLSG